MEAAKKNGVSPGTAKILAAEAVEKALEDTDGQPLTLVQGKEVRMSRVFFWSSSGSLVVGCVARWCCLFVTPRW